VPLAWLAFLLLTGSCATQERRHVKRRIDFRHVSDASPIDRDVDTCRDLASRTMRRVRDSRVEFRTAIWDQCLVNRGYRLRECAPRPLDPFACSGPGEADAR
jgi:hypothetical protein